MSFRIRAIDLLEREIIRLETKGKENALDLVDIQLLTELINGYAKLSAALDIHKNKAANQISFRNYTDKTLLQDIKTGSAKYSKPDKPIGPRSKEYNEDLD